MRPTPAITSELSPVKARAGAAWASSTTVAGATVVVVVVVVAAGAVVVVAVGAGWVVDVVGVSVTGTWAGPTVAGGASVVGVVATTGAGSPYALVRVTAALSCRSSSSMASLGDHEDVNAPSVSSTRR